jgi:hypothetical protein
MKSWLRRVLGELPSTSPADTLDDLQAAWRLWDLMRRLRPAEQQRLLAEAERLLKSQPAADIQRSGA